MDAGYVDALAAGGLILFTGADISATDGALEIMSKVGVVAVLWYWLKDMKLQMKSILKTFDKETNDIRGHYDQIIDELRHEHEEYKDRLDTQIAQKRLENLALNEKLYDLVQSKIKDE